MILKTNSAFFLKRGYRNVDIVTESSTHQLSENFCKKVFINFVLTLQSDEAVAEKERFKNLIRI